MNSGPGRTTDAIFSDTMRAFSIGEETGECSPSKAAIFGAAESCLSSHLPYELPVPHYPGTLPDGMRDREAHKS